MTICVYRQNGDKLKRSSLDGVQNVIFNSQLKNHIQNEQLEYEKFKKSNSSSMSFIEWKRQHK